VLIAQKFLEMGYSLSRPVKVFTLFLENLSINSIYLLRRPELGKITHAYALFNTFDFQFLIYWGGFKSEVQHPGAQ
jgi:hypothetical protein